jgi:hypothetical protein
MTFCRLDRVRICLVVSLALYSFGCGSTESTSAPTGAPSAKDSLSDLVSLLNHLKSENKKPPARVADIEPIEPLFQGAYLGLVRGDIVYLWETTIDPAGADKVLAYEKAVESTSGWVLMQDGSLKTMDTAQFQAAPKAAK